MIDTSNIIQKVAKELSINILFLEDKNKYFFAKTFYPPSVDNKHLVFSGIEITSCFSEQLINRQLLEILQEVSKVLASGEIREILLSDSYKWILFK